MLIENYKGVEIHHNATSDEFFTNIVILKGEFGKKDQVIRNGRLQATRDHIDKFLNTASKKPVVPKAWYRGKYNSDNYEKVDVILISNITDTIQIKRAGKILTVGKDRHRNNEQGNLYLCCKENDAIISNLNKKQKEIEKIEKEISCSSGKLIPFSKEEHFN